MSRARLAVLFLSPFLAVILAIGVNYWLTYQQNRNWCGALGILTAKAVPYPADAAKNPSRVETWELYEDFVHIKHSFGC